MATNNHNFIISITVKKQAVPAQFSRIDWMGLINETYPIVFASPEDTAGRKSALYSLLQKFAKVMRVDFEDAAYWVSRKVLDDRFSEARRMYAGEKAWARWSATYPHAHFAPVLHGKDLGEQHAAAHAWPLDYAIPTTGEWLTAVISAIPTKMAHTGPMSYENPQPDYCATSGIKEAA